MKRFKYLTHIVFNDIEKYLNHNKKYLFSTAINLTILFIISIALQTTGIFNIQRFINLQLFTWIVIAFNITALRLHHKATKSSISEDIFKYGFLLLILFQVIKICFNIELLNIPNTDILLLTIILGIITFHDKRQIINDIEKETKDEYSEEKNREQNFAKNHPKMNKIPALNHILKWMHKIGWLYSFILIIIITNGFFISFVNLDILPLQNDEFLTTSAVKSILSGELVLSDFLHGSDSSLSTKWYSRAWPYSLCTAFFVKILGSSYPYSYFSLRIFSVIAGTMTLILFFYLMRHMKVNKTVCLFSTYSFSVFFIFVYYSRVARMYCLLLPLFFVVCFLLFKLLNKIIKSKASLFSDIKTNFLSILLILIVIIVSLIIHKNILTVFIPLYILLIYYSRTYKKLKLPVTICNLCLSAVLLLLILGYKLIGMWYFNVEHEIYSKFLVYCYTYLAGKEITLIIFASLLFSVLLLKKTKLNPSLKIAYFIFLSILPHFIFLANGKMFHDPRYILFLYPLYIFISVYTLFYLSRILFPKNKYACLFAFTGMFILIITNIQITNICFDSPITDCPITHESRIFSTDRWSYNHDETYSFIKENMKDGGILVGRTLYGYYLDKYELRNEISLLNGTRTENNHETPIKDNLLKETPMKDNSLKGWWRFDNSSDLFDYSLNNRGMIVQQWTDMTGIDRRDQAGVEYLDGMIYVVGGWYNGDKNTTYAYNISNDSWTQKADIPLDKVQSPILRAVNGKLYCIGGYNAGAGIKFNTTFEYNPSNDTWTQKSNMSIGREDHASAVVDDCIYIFGGIETGSGHPITNIVERYNVTSDTWTNMSNMPYPRALGDYAATYNGKIYLVSGEDNLSTYPTISPSVRVDMYNPSTDTWTQKTDAPTGRCYKEVEEVNGKLYVMGGSITNNNNITNINEIYDIATDTWSTGQKMIGAATGVSTASYDGKIYIVGGTVAFRRFDTTLITGRYTPDGKFGGGRTFDGLYDYINIPNMTDIVSKNNNYAVELWFKRNDNKTNRQVLFASSSGGSDRHGIELNSNEIRVGYYNGSSYQSKSTSLIATDKDWHHIAMVMISGNMTGYLDGELMTGSNNVGLSYYAKTRIGARTDNTGHFNGTIDEVAIYQSDDICKSDNTTGLIGCWDFNELYGTTAKYMADNIFNNNNGTLTDMNIKIYHLGGTKISLDNIKNKNVFLVIYPKIVYKRYSNAHIYNYLYNHPKKQKIYQTNDGRVRIYKIEAEHNR